MSAIKKIRSAVARLVISNRLRRFRHFVARLIRRLRGERREVHFFYQIDDPYSHLLAQRMVHFESQFNVDVVLHLVAAPSDDMAPEREALDRYAARDAHDLACHMPGLSCPEILSKPSQKSYEFALRAIARLQAVGPALIEIGDLYWRGEEKSLAKRSMMSSSEAHSCVKAGTALRDKLGHYLGAMLYYEKEWYWGVDRLPYLEQRLTLERAQISAVPSLGQFPARPAFMSQPAKRRLTVEFFPSLRSPYSYLAMQEVRELSNHYPISVVWRPVLPMVMRGLPVPSRKGTYILKDARREAQRINVPFGNVSDPVGEPVRRGYSLLPYARRENRAEAFLHAFCTLAWSEGVDLGTDRGLRLAVERAGLDWQVAQDFIGKSGWEDELEENQHQLMASGLWGVPSFRLLGPRGREIYSTWGRDRIWLLCHHIQEELTRS